MNSQDNVEALLEIVKVDPNTNVPHGGRQKANTRGQTLGDHPLHPSGAWAHTPTLGAWGPTDDGGVQFSVQNSEFMPVWASQGC